MRTTPLAFSELTAAMKEWRLEVMARMALAVGRGTGRGGAADLEREIIVAELSNHSFSKGVFRVRIE